MNPYGYILESPEMLFWYAFVACILAAWVFVSYRKLFKWVTSVKAASERWDQFLLPPDDLTWEIVGILAVVGANLGLIGLFVYVVV